MTTPDNRLLSFFARFVAPLEVSLRGVITPIKKRFA